MATEVTKVPQLDRIEMMLQLAFKHMLMPRPESRLFGAFGKPSALSEYEQELLSSLIHTEHYST